LAVPWAEGLSSNAGAENEIKISSLRGPDLIDRCIAKAVYSAALYAETPQLYLDANQGQCCPGGMVWMGFNEPHPKLKYFVTVGTPDFLGGMAEHLKATLELFEEQRKRAGKITPPGTMY